MLYKIIKFIILLFCRHKKSIEIFRCYQDRYVINKCSKCNKEIYKDL